MDSRGQAYSVFKLLIAAIVAGAILLILLQTLQILPNIGSTNPNSAASNAVKSKINEPGLPDLIENITFNKGDSLNAKTIALESKVIDQERVCVLVSESAPNYEAFDTPTDKVLIYEGSFTQKSRLLVMCDRGDELTDSLEAYGYDDDPYNIDTADCEGIDTTNKYCLVAVISD